MISYIAVLACLIFLFLTEIKVILGEGTELEVISYDPQNLGSGRTSPHHLIGGGRDGLKGWKGMTAHLFLALTTWTDSFFLVLAVVNSGEDQPACSASS